MSDLYYHPEDDHPHVDTTVCGKCRKPFERGHRIAQALIFERRGVNPKNLGNTGVYLFADYEFVHVDCRDPYLKKGLFNA